MSTETVPKGYKRTEVGVIPEEWEFRLIGDLNPFVTSGSRGWAEFYSEVGDLFIRITNLSRACIYPNLEDLRFVNLSSGCTEGARTNLQDDDLLISITADIGIIGYVDTRMPKPAYINQHIAIVRFEQSKACSKFVSYFLASEKPQRLFRALTDSGAKAGMNLATVKQVRLALPPTLDEQQAIAAALSDADALIESLEQLLAKKRQIKQGAMQELLTGKRRLPGFTGKWETKRLLDIVSLIHGRAHEPFVSDIGVFVVVNSKFVATEGRVRKYCTKNISAACAGDVLMVLSDLPNGRALAKCFLVELDNVYAVNQRVCIYRPISVDSKYLCYLINRLPHFLALDDGVTQTHILNADISRCEILTACDIKEQSAIAAFLSDMDAELEAIEAKLDKARQVKQGMMQQLLTGKVRLV